jgi:excisionase family DNA binding protein
MELLTVNEVATMLRVSPLTVRRHIASGRLRALRVGRRIRVPRECVESAFYPAAKPKSSGAEEPGRSEELTRRRQIVKEILEARRALGSRPGPTAVELIRMAREEEGASYDPGRSER